MVSRGGMKRVSARIGRQVWHGGASAGAADAREVPTEVPIAISYQHETHAVMLATPADLEDFAVGFSLSEGIVRTPREILDLEICLLPGGIEARMWLDDAAAQLAGKRRRTILGPAGCGLCGVESLAAALPALPRTRSRLRVGASEISQAVAMLSQAQELGTVTRAVHAAGFFLPTGGLVALREDVGRHNALDKLVGALARGGHAPRDGMVVLTSRLSVELVQKTARMGVPILVAMSAPTELAVRSARAAGMTLIGVARADGFEIYTHPERVGGSGR